MGRCGRRLDDRLEFFSIEKLNAVIGSEMVAFVVPVVGIGGGVALLRVADERSLSFGQLAVGQDVDAFVADQPEAGLLALSRLEAIVGIAESAIGGRIGMPRAMTSRTFSSGKVNMNSSSALGERPRRGPAIGTRSWCLR